MSFVNSLLGMLRFNRKNGKAVVLCIFAATIFWFFNALNKNYTTNITFPVSFDYNVENYIAVRPLPHQVKINVTGIGWDLFRRSIGIKVSPLVIPLERPSEVKKIVGSTLPMLFVNQLERLQINFVLTDTLFIALEPKASRWISLKLDTPSLLFRDGHTIVTKPVIRPDSIYIEGPFKLVQSISEPFYLKIDDRNIDRNYSEEMEVKFLNQELILRNPPVVSVSFEVDALITVKDSLELVFRNAPPGLKLPRKHLLWPCELRIPKRYAGNYHRDSVSAIIDLAGIKQEQQWVFPSIEGLPPQAYISKADSIQLNR